MTAPDVDVAIAGGGLAGLSAARYLRREHPRLRIVVVERRPHPVPESAFKVGESSVEIGAHFFQRVLDLDQHLRGAQLEKFGLRYFFPSGDNCDLAQRAELGPCGYPTVPSFQLDRGRFENELLRLNREDGVRVLDGASVSHIELGSEVHRLDVKSSEGTQTISARWLIDASGRGGLLRRKLGLTREVAHAASACWFRIDHRLRVDDWTADPKWKASVPNGERWLSTNHLMGQGYWVWLIPLGSGSTSVGIVADESHPFNEFNRFERALDWLRVHEPQCAAIVEQHRDGLQDFLALRHYAFGSERVFSPDRWLLLGEAGVFTDPFYSPGSDFIAIGCEMAGDLIGRDMAGEAIDTRLERFNTVYLRLFEAFLKLYDGQYQLMGNAQVMTAKVAWDNACYWAIVGVLYFQRRLRDVGFLDSVEPLLRRFFVLHARMQALLRAWCAADLDRYGEGRVSIVDVPFLRELQGALASPPMDADALKTRLESNMALLERFARTLQSMAAARNPALHTFVAPASADEQLLDLSALEMTRQPATVVT